MEKLDHLANHVAAAALFLLFMIAPLTTKSRKYPTLVQFELKERKCRIVLDQIRTVDRERLEDQEGMLSR